MLLKVDCSNPFGFGDMAFLMIFSIVFFFEKLGCKKLIKLEILNSFVGCCLGKLRNCETGVQVQLLKFFYYRDMAFFFDFFNSFFFEKLRCKKINRT